MKKLTAEDLEFFSAPRNWGGGPMYELRLFYPPEFPKLSIEEALFQFGGLIRWQPEPDPKPRLYKSVYQIEGVPSVGFVHCYRQISVVSSEYSLAIYPPQYRRAVGDCLDENSWDVGRQYSELAQLAKLHDAFFLLIARMKMETPMLCASICPEFWGSIDPVRCGTSICISRALASILNVDAMPIEQMPEYAAIVF